MKPLLSILTPGVPSRWPQIEALHAELARQIGDLPVEHLILVDNKRRTVGEKRDALLRAAGGAYVAFCDDDDAVTPDYVAALLAAIRQGPDVVTFRQLAVVNGASGDIEFRLGNPNEGFKPGGVTRCFVPVPADELRRRLGICRAALWTCWIAGGSHSRRAPRIPSQRRNYGSTAAVANH
jgi:glycosyltransferase involved in cell wall biosynthesis